MKIKIGKSDKLSVPGRYETTGTSLEAEFELPDTTDPVVIRQAMADVKEVFERMYWPLVNYDFTTYLQRLRMGTSEFLTWKTSEQ
jgi:hypothetical protein